MTGRENHNVDTPEPMVLTMKEAAAAIQVCERTIWSAIKEGRLKVVRLGRLVRIRGEELDRFLRDLES